MLGEPGQCAEGHRVLAVPFCLYGFPRVDVGAPSLMRVDLNADVGESFGAYAIGHDRGLMKAITSANIAAGFHGGDPSVLRQTIRLAKEYGVAIGAHPSFPDLVGFGRREMHVSATEAEDFVLYQIAAVAGVASTEGLRLQHVKPHGALFNMAARDSMLASAIARAVAAFDRTLILFGLPESELLRAGHTAGLRVAAEGFADRAYEADGSLASRKKPGAVVHDAKAVVERATQMVRDRSVVAMNGAVVTLKIDTICVHSDTEGADVLAARVRQGLEAAGVTVSSFSA
jgi:5-oxoprolinase (ATP-hydrolysing) subunit A